jgi:hypothetical protein
MGRHGDTPRRSQARRPPGPGVSSAIRRCECRGASGRRAAVPTRSSAPTSSCSRSTSSPSRATPRGAPHPPGSSRCGRGPRGRTAGVDRRDPSSRAMRVVPRRRAGLPGSSRSPLSRPRSSSPRTSRADGRRRAQDGVSRPTVEADMARRSRRAAAGSRRRVSDRRSGRRSARDRVARAREPPRRRHIRDGRGPSRARAVGRRGRRAARRGGARGRRRARDRAVFSVPPAVRFAPPRAGRLSQALAASAVLVGDPALPRWLHQSARVRPALARWRRLVLAESLSLARRRRRPASLPRRRALVALPSAGGDPRPADCPSSSSARRHPRRRTAGPGVLDEWSGLPAKESVTGLAFHFRDSQRGGAARCSSRCRPRMRALGHGEPRLDPPGQLDLAKARGRR